MGEGHECASPPNCLQALMWGPSHNFCFIKTVSHGSPYALGRLGKVGAVACFSLFLLACKLGTIESTWDALRKGKWRFKTEKHLVMGFPGGARGKESTCQCRRCRFDPWFGKVPWRRAWQLTPVFLPGESPWTKESGGLQFMESQRVRQNWSD